MARSAMHITVASVGADWGSAPPVWPLPLHAHEGGPSATYCLAVGALATEHGARRGRSADTAC